MRNPLVALSLLITAAFTPAPKLADGQAPPVAAPYDVAADAHAAVDAAFARAHATGRRVLVDFGGNWCGDCRVLAGILANPAVHDWAQTGFETVLVDVGRLNKNMDIAERWGVHITAVPTVLVLTADGKLLNPGNVFALADARAMSAQAVVDLLATWRAPG